MKAISIHQPWATLIVFGKKRILAMNRHTSHRGPIAIHACETELPDYYYQQAGIKADLTKCIPGMAFSDAASRLPHGQVIGAVDLLDVFIWAKADPEITSEYAKHPDIKKGSCVWLLGNARLAEPFRVRGRPAVFSINATI